MGKKLQKPQSDIIQRVKELETLSPKSEFLIKSFPQGSRNPVKKEAERMSELFRGVGGHQESKLLKINMGKAHMSSHNLR